MKSLIFLLISVSAFAAEPQLTIKDSNHTRTYSRSDLMKSPQLKQITTENDPVFPGKKMTYWAVPVASLFEGIHVAADNTLLFTALDGFSAPISSSRILNTDPSGSIAYIAIEKEGEPWPPMKPDSPKTAGPFYLIWDDIQKSNIGPEEWPFQLAGFEVKPSMESQFPNAVPDPSIAAQNPIRVGYRAFMKNCFACHSINGEGGDKAGPDLNVPNNPTEYFKPGFIAKLIRDPQQLRHWPSAKMNGFDSSVLPDQDVQDIISYLEHMAGRKVAIP